MTTTVYSGRVTNWPLFWTVNLLAVALVAFSGAPDVPLLPVVVAAVVLLLVNLTMTSVRTTAGPGGVVVRFGLLGLPRLRYPLPRIATVEALDVPLARLGGLGVHWNPWHGTRLSIRPGPSLRLVLDSGRTVLISAEQPDVAVAAVLDGRDTDGCR